MIFLLVTQWWPGPLVFATHLQTYTPKRIHVTRLGQLRRLTLVLYQRNQNLRCHPSTSSSEKRRRQRTRGRPRSRRREIFNDLRHPEIGDQSLSFVAYQDVILFRTSRVSKFCDTFQTGSALLTPFKSPCITTGLKSCRYATPEAICSICFSYVYNVRLFFIQGYIPIEDDPHQDSHLAGRTLPYRYRTTATPSLDGAVVVQCRVTVLCEGVAVDAIRRPRL